MSIPSEKITVMLVDDSSVIRGVLSNMLKSDPCIKVVASVSNGEHAVVMAKSKQPDVVILDVEMPVMDGLTALPEILKNSPDTKVIMCSSLTAKGADTTIKAMALGAVECLVKPTSAIARDPDSPFRKRLLNLVRSLGAIRRRAHPTGVPRTPGSVAAPTAVIGTGDHITLKKDIGVYKGKPSIFAIGSSTGGPKALFKVLSDIKALNVPIVITQHMPATFTKILAEHISHQTGVSAFEGADGMVVESGKVYIAPGSRHMLFEEKGGRLTIQLDDGPEENFCKPSVDPMLRSLMDIYGNKVFCVILTGMGHDGLKEAKILAECGGRIIAQDEKTSVVWGMPGAVAMAGICSAVLPLEKIGPSIKQACHLR
ncbi:MAG: chemotaxis response regulator protein-glutamate methylesterase [Alphaproteobacteria bacterium]|nr:chemotaxis response regulator protein-glutamate methylesterase [Alphaproteobacteria bacterium]